MNARTVVSSSVLLLVGATSVMAQDVTVTFEATATASGPGVNATWVGPGAGIGLMAIEPFGPAPAIKGAPYTAEAVTETTQALADGNRIEQRTSGTIARDGNGRVRRQQEAAALGGLVGRTQSLVTITDPAGLHVTLDQDRRVAYRMKMPTFPVNETVTRQMSSAGGPNVLLPMVAPAGIGPGQADIFTAAIASAPFPVGGRGKPLATAVAPSVETEQLGERMIEGVRAEGTRTTMTIEANAIGNQSPILVVNERWYSPELQVVVLSRRSDPRFGETVYRLVDIVRAEPPVDLFEIPSDYQVKEQGVRGRHISNQ